MMRVTQMAASKDLNLMPLDAIRRLQQVTLQAQGNMSQRVFAEKLGLSQSIIHDWLAGNIKEWPKTGSLKPLAASLGWTPGQLIDYLAQGKNTPSPSIERLIGIINNTRLSLTEAAQISQAVSSHVLNANFEANN